MASQIDPSLPADGVPAVKDDLRANLQAAKDEIEALQEDKAEAMHGHPAADIEAAGTADATTFLRGDGTWTNGLNGPLEGNGQITTNWAIAIATHDEAYTLLAADRTRRLVFSDTVDRTWKIPALPPGEVLVVNRSVANTLFLTGTTEAAGDPSDVTVNGVVGGTVAIASGEAGTILTYGDATAEIFKGALASVS